MNAALHYITQLLICSISNPFNILAGANETVFIKLCIFVTVFIPVFLSFKVAMIQNKCKDWLTLELKTNCNQGRCNYFIYIQLYSNTLKNILAFKNSQCRLSVTLWNRLKAAKMTATKCEFSIVKARLHSVLLSSQVLEREQPLNIQHFHTIIQMQHSGWHCKQECKVERGLKWCLIPAARP